MTERSIEILSTQEAAVEVSRSRFNRNVKKAWGLPGENTGIHDLNLLFGGWQRGKLYTIGGRSGHGKSACIVPIIKARRISENRMIKFCCFSWEMMGDIFVDRCISFDTGLSSIMLNQGAKLLTTPQLEAVDNAYEATKELPIVYQESSTDIHTVKRIYNKFAKDCYEEGRELGIEIIPAAIIDYIGMAQFSNESLRTYAVGEFMNGCKKLANETGGVFIVLAQLLRGSDDKKLPERGDIKDSSDIENASDALILLHRPEYNGVKEFPDNYGTTENKAMFRVLKNRMGPVNDLIVNCDIRLNRFYSLDHHHEYEFEKLYKQEAFWRKHFGL